MIKAIIFDFDGVIIESTQIKTEAFKELFSSWPEKIEEIIAYHRKNMGISRYVKFKHIHELILKIPYDDIIEDELGRRFSEIVLEKVKNAPYVDGAMEFLNRNYKRYSLFIASGTPQHELEEIVASRRLNPYFKAVLGAPKTKTKIIEEIKKRWNLISQEIVFVGDAESDMKAAKKEKAHFILRRGPDTDADNTPLEIKDLRDLENIIERIEKCV